MVRKERKNELSIKHYGGVDYSLLKTIGVWDWGDIPFAERSRIIYELRRMPTCAVLAAGDRR